MKKIINIFLILFFALNVFAQKIELSKSFEETLKIEFEKRKSNWDGNFDLFKKIQIEAFQQIAFSKKNTKTLNSVDCGDAGFESGALNPLDWGGFYKKFTNSNFDCSSLSSNNINTSANPWVSGLAVVAPTSCEYPGWSVNMSTYCTIPTACSSTIESSLSHFYITPVGNDPIVGALLPKVRPSIGNTKSLRLGNAFPWNGTEKLTKTFTVNSTNQIFSFWYALVMGKPESHGAAQLPTFIVQVIENATSGSILHNGLVNLSGASNFISAYDPLFLSTTSYINPCSMTGTREDMVYKPWSFFSMNLNSLIGKNITVEIITRDCAPSGHFSYAYLDDFCSPPDPSNPSGSISLGNKDTCGLGNICVNYTLPQTPTTTGSTILHLYIYQSGSLITTLNSPTLPSGTNYCFPITAALLASLTSGSDFDYSVKGDFLIGTTSLTSQYLGFTGSGQDLLTNNDYAIQCKTPCQCGQWGSTGYTLGNTSNKFNCNGTTNIINANLGDVFSLFPSYTCIGGTVAQACNPTFSYDVYYANGGVLLDVKNIKDQKIDSCGDIRIVMKVKCGNVVCPPCEFILRVNCCQCAKDPKPYLFWTTGSGNAILDKQLDLKCGETYTDKLKCFQPYVIKVQSPCGVNCQPDSIITTIQPPTGPLQVSYSLAGATIIANQVGTYIVTIKVKCGGKWCAPCVIRFIQTQKCEPPCDNCKDKVAFEFDSGASAVVVQTHPTASTLNATFVLGGGADTYTQLRVNVVDFQITSDNPACLQCYNMPNQWGSILGGTVSGFTPSITTYPGVGAANANNNPREIIFSTTTPAAISMGTNLNLSIRVPGVNPISCCCIKVVLYIKITYRNNKCEECTKIVKVGFTECPGGNVDPATGNSGGTATFDPDGGHPQFRLHAPNNEDAQILNRNSILKSKQ